MNPAERLRLLERAGYWNYERESVYASLQKRCWRGGETTQFACGKGPWRVPDQEQTPQLTRIRLPHPRGPAWN